MLGCDRTAFDSPTLCLGGAGPWWARRVGSECSVAAPRPLSVFEAACSPQQAPSRRAGTGGVPWAATRLCLRSRRTVQTPISPASPAVAPHPGARARRTRRPLGRTAWVWRRALPPRAQARRAGLRETPPHKVRPSHSLADWGVARVRPGLALMCVCAIHTLRIAGGLSWASLSPALLLVDDFLSSSECDALVALASSGARRGSRRRLDVTDGVASRPPSLSRHRRTHKLGAHQLLLLPHQR